MADEHDKPNVKVLLVEDQPAILAQQKRLLEQFDTISIVGTARDGARAIDVIGALQPDVVLLDLGLPDMDGVELTRCIREKWSSTEVLVFTIFDQDDRVLAAIKAGASGYLLKGTPAARIVDALHDVHAGGSVIQPRLARNLLRRFQSANREPDTPSLTNREVEVLTIIAKGLSNRSTADSLGVSRATVRTHLEHIYAKLDVANRTEAVAEAIRRGLIDP